MKKILFIAFLLMPCSSWAYYYYLGPFVETVNEDKTTTRKPPEGTKGLIDLSCRNIPNVTFIAADKELDKGYTFFGEGNINEISVDLDARLKWRDVMGYLPKGQKLSDLLWDQLTDGSDPYGVSAPKPLIPTSKGKVNLRLGGHQIVRSEQFKWGDLHTDKIRAVIQSDLIKIRDLAQSGQMVNPITKTMDTEYHRRVAQAYLDKYKMSWADLRPAGWSLSEEPMERNTTITDDFNGSDSLDLGIDLAWTDKQGNFENYLNEAYTSGFSAVRADDDLSTDDMYAQAVGKTGSVGVAVRFASDFTAYYIYIISGEFDIVLRTGGSSNFIAIESYYGGLNKTFKIEADGSDIIGYADDVEIVSVTDTGLTGEYGAGLVCNSCTMDDFEAEDLPSSPSGGVAHERRRVVLAQ